MLSQNRIVPLKTEVEFLERKLAPINLRVMKLSEDLVKIQQHSIPDTMDHVNTLNTRLISLQNRSTNSVSSNDSSHNSVSDLRKPKESSSHITEYFNPSSKSKMERFMSFDISLKDTSRDSILSFYHLLQVMGPCFVF